MFDDEDLFSSLFLLAEEEKKDQGAVMRFFAFSQIRGEKNISLNSSPAQKRKNPAKGEVVFGGGRTRTAETRR